MARGDQHLHEIDRPIRLATREVLQRVVERGLVLVGRTSLCQQCLGSDLVVIEACDLARLAF